MNLSEQGCLQNSSKIIPLFFSMRAQDYLAGDSIAFRCVDISKNNYDSIIYFTPNPISNEEESSLFELTVESNPQIIHVCYEEFKKGRIYTLADMEDVTSDIDRELFPDNGQEEK